MVLSGKTSNSQPGRSEQCIATAGTFQGNYFMSASSQCEWGADLALRRPGDSWRYFCCHTREVRPRARNAAKHLTLPSSSTEIPRVKVEKLNYALCLIKKGSGALKSQELLIQ